MRRTRPSPATAILPVENILQGLDVAYDVQADKIVAVGYSNIDDTGEVNPAVRRYAILQTDPNGVLDRFFANEFGADSFRRFQTASFDQPPFRDIASDLILLDDGRIIVAGPTQDGPSPRSASSGCSRSSPRRSTSAT